MPAEFKNDGIPDGHPNAAIARAVIRGLTMASWRTRVEGLDTGPQRIGASPGRDLSDAIADVKAEFGIEQTGAKS